MENKFDYLSYAEASKFSSLLSFCSSDAESKMKQMLKFTLANLSNSFISSRTLICINDSD